MSLLQQIVQRDEGSLADIDNGVTNKFKWEWLERTVSVDVKKAHPKLNWTSDQLLTICLKDCIRKMNKPGKAVCIVCHKKETDVLTYGTAGVNVLKNHVLTKGHIERVVTEMQCYKLPGAASEPVDANYGAPLAFYGVPAERANPPPQATVHLTDRVMNQEAMVTAFLAEKSLSFNLAEPMIDMARELARDPQALSKLHLFRTTASYKLVYGTSKTFNDKLVEVLQTTPFSLNMDEATATNNTRICAVLVTYCKGNEIITEHLNSFDLPVVNSEVLFEGVKSLFQEMKLP